MTEPDRFLEREASVHIDAELARVAAEYLDDGLDALEVLFERHEPDLHLHGRIATVEIGAHFLLELPHPFPRVVISSGGVDPSLRVGLPAVVAVGEKAPERH